VLPFHIAASEKQAELDEFSRHVDKRLRAALELLGHGVTAFSEAEIDRLVGARGVPANDADALDLARETGADLVIYGVLSIEGASCRMKGVMLDAHEGRASVSSDFKVANIHALPGVLQVFIRNVNMRIQGSPTLPFYKSGPPGATDVSAANRVARPVGIPRDAGPWRSGEIPAALRAVDIGDMDGDGKNETVLVGANGALITRFEDGSLKTLAQFSQPPASYISAEVEDIDGDGVSELLLCSQGPEGLRSEVIRYRKRNFSVWGEFPNVILATVPDPSDRSKRILLGQKTDSEDMFSGEMIRYRMEESGPRPNGKVLLPPGTLLLSYAGGALGKSQSPLRIVLNQDQRLMVFDEENRLLHSVAGKVFGLERSTRVPIKKGRLEIAVPGRLRIADTNGDGENELLVVRQSEGGSLVEALVWEENQLKSSWRTVTSQGLITDFQIRDFKNAAAPSLVLLLVKSNPLAMLLGAGSSVVYAYDLTP
jgi:hypothetical protein